MFLGIRISRIKALGSLSKERFDVGGGNEREADVIDLISGMNLVNGGYDRALRRGVREHKAMRSDLTNGCGCLGARRP